jgi:shikimate kinase
MSGVGKSFWARRLAIEAGFVVHDCDAEIGRRLGAIVTASPGEELVTALGRWMGMPWSDAYAEREARYLALEETVTREALDAAREGHVVDTTGSAIYLSRALRDRMHAECRVVYLRTPDVRRSAMLQRYLEEPKPVVWAGAFPAATSDPHAALPTAYATLLTLRDHAYTALAHVTLDGGELERTPPTTAEFLARIAD